MAYDYSVRMIKCVNGLEIKINYYSFIDQVLRSATYVVEGKSGNSKTDDIKRLYPIASKSLKETQYWFFLFKDGLDKLSINKLLKEVDELSKIIAKSISTLKREKERGCIQFLGFTF